MRKIILTEEIEKNIVEDCKNKMSVKDICEKYDIYSLIVKNIREKYNIPPMNNFCSEETKTKVIEDYKTNKDKTDLARKHNLSTSTIDKIVRPPGLLTGMTRLEKAKYMKDNIEDIATDYLSGKTSREISRELDVDKKSVLAALRKYGVEFRNPSERHRSYTVNDKVFENINTFEKAYWLGFLGGDGCNTGTGIRIALKASDRLHLEKFRDFMGSNAKIYNTVKYDEKYNKKHYGCLIVICNKKISNDLSKLGITIRKTYDYKFPQFLEEKYYASYLLGLIDSDGCFYYYSNDKYFGINFIGTYDVVHNFAKILMDNCNITVKISKYRDNNFNYVFCVSGGGQPIKVVKFLYKDLYNTETWLKRKKEKAFNFYGIEDYEEYFKDK
jgi:hypothetical protein